MLLRLTVTVAGRSARADRPVATEVEVDPPAQSTVGELARSLATHLDAGDGPWILAAGGRVVPCVSLVGRAPIVDGAALTLSRSAPPSPGPSQARGSTPVALAVPHGPDAGHSIPIPRGRHTIGRSTKADVCLEDSRLSRRHAEICVDSDAITVRDLGSTNGTFLADLPVGATPVRVETGLAIAVGSTIVTVRPSHSVPAACVSRADGTRGVNRRPRVGDPPVSRSVAFPPPPETPSATRLPWVAIVVPMLAASVMALFFGPAMLAFALVGPLVTGSTTLHERIGTRRTYAARLAQHEREAREARDQLEGAIAQEIRERGAATPDPAEILAIAAAPHARLWERGRGDDDALAVAIGRCTCPARVQATGTPSVGAAAGTRLVTVPCVVPLGAVGVLGINGPRRCVVGAARSILGQLVVLHSPLDLSVVCVAAHARDARSWEWLARLPHLRAANGGARPHSWAVLAQDPVATAAAVAHVAHLVADRAAHHPPGRDWDGSRLVMLLDGPAELRGLPGLAQILEAGPRVGVCFIALAPTAGELPTETRSMLDLGMPDDPSLTIEGHRHVDLVVDRVGCWWAERLSRALAPLRDATPSSTGSALPGTVSLAEVAQIDVTDPAAIHRLWDRAPRAIDIPVGVGPRGTFRVDLAADGPHALVGGTTGAGKSELLRALVVSLAVHNRPDQLSLVLIDYKGGAAFRECSQLPQVCGVVTDLDGHLAARALTSLNAELRRRERVLAEADVTDFDAYLRRPASARAPLPRLVIVIDEFRALAEELPAFVDGMVRIAALGRSLGIHLVIATQRPAGVVTADIKANLNLRVALRMRDREDSQDVVDATDAAELDPQTPGRACIRVGGARLESFQAAYVGGPGADARPRGIRVRTVAWGAPAAAWAPSDSGEPDGPTELAQIVAAVTAAAHAMGAPSAPPAWLPDLPQTIRADSLGAAQCELSAPIGLVDDPAAQRQSPLHADLLTPGHWGFAGATGSGRSTALTTFATALAARSGPAKLHLYAVRGGSLARLGDLPHCGAHVDWDDLPRLARLVDRLETEVASRRQRLAASAHASMAEWWSSAGGFDAQQPAPPALVLLVDDWDQLAHRADTLDDVDLPERLLAVMREGAGVGLRAAIAGERSLLAGRAAGLVTHRILLRLTDHFDAALVGLPATALPEAPPPGRGVLADGREVQVALPRVVPPPAGMPPGLLPWRVEALPMTVRERDLPPDCPPEVTVLGVGGDDQTAYGLSPEEDGRRWLVAGAAGSGVSTTLLLVARDLLRKGRRVAVVCGRPGALDAARDDPRLTAWCDPSDVKRLSAAHRELPDLAVVVDDGDQLVDSPIEPALREISRGVDRSGGLVVCGASSTALATQYRGLAVELARHRTGLLLGPSGLTDADLFGVRVRVDRAARPGRGYLMRAGVAVPIQVAEAEAG